MVVQSGGVAHQKYRLVDPEGIDITVDELIERYLSIPEICFKQGWTEPAIVFSNLNYLEVIQKNILSLPPYLVRLLINNSPRMK